MSKEPIGLYIFRFVVGLGLFAFMCMLYWSSTLVEQNLIDLRTDIGELKNDLFNLRADVNRVREDVLKSLVEALLSQKHSVNPDEFKQSGAKQSHRPQIDQSLPNLLEEDPFYENVLPKLLGPNFKPQGTFQSATIGRFDNLNPFSQWSVVAGWISQCTVSVAKQMFGKYETMTPDMAIKMEERKNKVTGAPEFWIHLRDGVFWHPLSPDLFPENFILAPQFLRKHQVTAEDFKFYFDAVMNPYNQEPGAVALRTFLGDIEELEVIDKLTFVVRWKTKMIKNAEGKRSSPN